MMVNTVAESAREAGPELDRHGILAEIRRRGSSLRRLSVEAGFAPSTFCAALSKYNHRPQAVIARFIGRRPHELWPHWYGPDDQPLPFEQREALARRRKAA